MTAKEYLLNLQKKNNTYYGLQYQDYDEFREKYLKMFHLILNEKTLQEMFFKHKSEEENLPSAYQNSLFYNYIKESIIPLESLIRDNTHISFYGNDVLLKSVPLYGTLEQSTHNASVTIVNGEPLITINEGLIELLRGLSDLVSANMLYGIYDTKIQQDIIRHYIDFIVCSIFYKNKAAANLWTLDNNIVEINESFILLAAELFNSALLFVFAHEYSHYVLNHFSKQPLILNNNFKNKNCILQWEKEYDADLLGMRIALSGRPYTKLIGIFMALEGCSLSEVHSFNAEGSHPSLSNRVAAIRNYARHNNFSPIQRYAFEMLIEPLAVQFQQFLEYMTNTKRTFSDNNLDEVQQIIYHEFPIVSKTSIFSIDWEKDKE